MAYNKCSVILFGYQNTESSLYSLSGISLQFVSSIRDLGVCLTSDLKPSAHCYGISAMAFNGVPSYRKASIPQMWLSLCVYTRCTCDHFWRIVLKFGTCGSK